MKKLIAIVLAITMLLSLTACGGSGDKPATTNETPTTNVPVDTTDTEVGLDYDNPVYIGVLDAFSGDRASNGEYSKQGADMAMEYINANGGVMGRAVELIYEDDQGTEAACTNAFQKIVSEYDLAAICLNKYSSMVLAMEQFVAEEGIPSICCGSSVKIEASETPNLFSSRRSDSGSGVTIATYCKELGMTKVAILHAPDALGTGMTPVILKTFEELGGIEAVSVQQFSSEEKNFAPYIAKIIDSGCDGVIAIAQQQEAGLIMSGIKESGLTVPCIGNSAFAQQVAIETSGGTCDGWYSCSAFSPTAKDEPTKTWIADFEAKYGRKPDMTSACMYDAVLMFCEAMNQTQSTEWEDIIGYLKTLDNFQGVGSSYTYSGTPMLSNSEFIVQIKGTSPEVVARVTN
ncbi:MAG: ABC transporter substrate-binding protein [Firmicutes bacterium]|nr:ABC transporter substrate-binding protein [Bacillota bacterium]